MKQILSYLPGLSRAAADDRYPRGGSAQRYDLLSKARGVNAAHWQLVAQAGIAPTATVLEIGTGTGNVALLAARTFPSATVIGIDPNAESLAGAAYKAEQAGVKLQLDLGSASALPYADGSIDRVLSSFMFHHLDGEDRLATLREVLRVLKPGGSFHALDLVSGRPQSWQALSRNIINHGLFPGRNKAHAPKNEQGHGHRHGHGHSASDAGLLELMTTAGMTDPIEVGRGRSALGDHAYYRSSI